MPTSDITNFLFWFQSEGGYVDLTALDIVDLPLSEGGRGAVALRDIPEGYTIFSIPWSLVFSRRTSVLLTKFGVDEWKKFKLDEGWTGLILSLMWEAALGSNSKWYNYFIIVPKNFDTPMFWVSGDLAELEGTAVVEKLGKEQVENDYKERIIPAMRSRPDLFPTANLAYFSLDMYHFMGSLLLTRSFTIPEDEDRIKKDNKGDPDGVEMEGKEVCLDPESSEGNDDDEQEEKKELVILPLADMLNARYGYDNVKAFCDSNCFNMVTTKPINAGDQIWNTYGNQPNSDLLRRFGFVDYVPLPAQLFGENKFGNPCDLTEIRADSVLEIARNARTESIQDTSLHERIDWWLEEGGDDVFLLEIDSSTKCLEALCLPFVLVSFIRMILYDSEWESSKLKGKPPKPKTDSVTLTVMRDVVKRRLEDYPTTLQDDEMRLDSCGNTLSPNVRHALIVRIGEKRILHIYLQRVDELLAEMKTLKVMGFEQ